MNDGRVTRSGDLPPEQVTRDEEIRRRVQEEFPPARPAAPPAPDSLAETLKRSIQESDLPVSELSKEADVSESLVRRFLVGERDIPITIADRLAGALGMRLTVE